MKKAMKRLAGLFAVILCCTMLFPLTATADGIVDEPAELPENMLITRTVHRDLGEYGNLVIETKTNGHFSFEFPAQTWTDENGIESTVSAFSVEGTAYYRIDKEKEEKFGTTNRSRYYHGEIVCNGQEIIYTQVHPTQPTASGPYNRTDQWIMIPHKASFVSHLTDGGEHWFEFRYYFHGTETQANTWGSGEAESIQIEMNDRDFNFDLKSMGFAEPILTGSSKDDEKNSKTTNNAKGSTATENSDFADPLTTLVISILAILLSILFGNTGGFIPSVPAGAGGAPAASPEDGGFSRWLSFDGDGDIETTDPVNGQRRTFVHNGNGTYTDPLSGATYTPEELSELMEYRADNAGTIRQDEVQFKNNVDEDSQRNQERSDESKQLEEDLQRERQERARREKIERVATELGISGASEDEIRQELARRMERDEDFRQKMNDYAQRSDTAVDILEATVEAADYGMAIGEVVVPGGKTVSATYKGIKNIGETVMEKGTSVGSVVEGVIKGGTEAATTVMDSSIGKAVTTIGGTVAGEIAGAVNDGEDITRATAEGLVKGAGNAAIGAISDAAGDAVKGGQASEAATKITETAFGKEVVEPLYDEAFKKDK